MLRDVTILLENVYNIEKTRVMLSMLGSLRAPVDKDNKRNYRGVRVKRTAVTASY